MTPVKDGSFSRVCQLDEFRTRSNAISTKAQQFIDLTTNILGPGEYIGLPDKIKMAICMAEQVQGKIDAIARLCAEAYKEEWK